MTHLEYLKEKVKNLLNPSNCHESFEEIMKDCKELESISKRIKYKCLENKKGIKN